jgi:alkylation response protein AidB-like acyl-CoA dehydrogenase
LEKPMPHFTFPPPPDAPAAEALRQDVRVFLRETLAEATPLDRARSWNGFDAEFTRKMAAQGWIGMTWPKRYGGQERSALERYVLIEEMLAAGAPVAAHWIADRQSGPLLLRFGTEQQKASILPQIAAGNCFFCIGMSEPDSGSDLAAARTRAVAVEGGYRVNGTKLWTTYGHKAHYMVLFCRTGETKDRHAGTCQFLVDLTTPGITIQPIYDMSGAHHFDEVVFEDVFLADSALIGQPGEGWAQVTSELAFERSGPDRFLSTFALFQEMIRVLRTDPSERAKQEMGRLTAHLIVLRRLSRSVAGLLQNGENPTLNASLVKDLGALVEQEMPEIARRLITAEPSLSAGTGFQAVLAHALLNVPSFSLRGGTREILRSIIARGLGLR